MTGPFSGYQQGLTYTASADRAVQYSKMTHGYNGLVADDGVLLGGQAVGASYFQDLLVAKTTGMNLTVQPGMAMVGGYSCVVPTVVNLTLDVSTTAARRDLIILRVLDQEAGDATNNTTVEIVKGTTASDPAIPARSLIICQCDIPASASSPTLTDRRKYTVAVGGVRPAYPSISSMDATKAAPGQIHFDTSSGRYYRRTANTWSEIIDSRFPVTTTTGQRIEARHVVQAFNVNGAGTITFSQPFSATPVVVANVGTYNDPRAFTVQLFMNQFTSSYVTLLLKDGNNAAITGSFDVYYIAIGPV